MAENREYQVQVAIIEYLKLQYPNVQFRSDGGGVPLTKAAAGKYKHIQKSNGWPDLFIAMPKRVTRGPVVAGLFIELKAEGTKLTKKNGDFTNKHIEQQANVLNELSAVGYIAKFAVGFNQAKDIIDDYLS